MPEKFKSFFSKMITDKKLKIILFSFVVLCIIFIPLKRVDALFGMGDLGIFDFTQTHLDSLDFVDTAILTIIVYVAALIAISQAFVLTSAHLLEWAMWLPIDIGATNNLVTAGWQFILGLTNLFFILAFVIIALAHILRLSNFEMKKALPRLIIIALLVNFSLVFIEIPLDIVNIFQRTLLEALGKGLVALAVQPLIVSSVNVAKWFFLVPAAAIAASFIPFWNSIALAGIGTLLLIDLAVGGVTLKALFLIVVNFLVGGIFLSYFVFFLMRIGMIWILAIFSPLAFFSYILPQTQGIWREWIKTLSEWLTLGIVAIFLTGLGLKFFAITGPNSIIEWGGDINTGRGSLPAFIYNYLFLLVYMGVAFFYSTKHTPQMAKTLLSYGKGLAGNIKKAATIPAMRKNVWGPGAKQLANAEDWGQTFIGKSKEAEAEGKVGRAMLMRWAGSGVRGLGKVVGTTTKPFRTGLIDYAAQQRRIPKPGNWDQMTVDDKANYINSLRQHKEKIVLASRMANEGDFAHADQEKFQNPILEILKSFGKDAENRELYGKEINDIWDVMSDQATLESELDLVTNEEDKKELKEKIETKAKQITTDAGLPENEYAQNLDLAASALRITAMKPADLVNKLRKGALTSKSGRIASREMTSRQIQRIHDTYGRDTIDDIFNGDGGLNNIFEEKLKGFSGDKKIEEGRKLLDQEYRRNRALVHFFVNTNPGKAMNWSGLEYMDKDKENGKIDFDMFKERISPEDERTKRQKERAVSEPTLEKISKVNQLEKDILSKLGEEKDIKEEISEYKKELRGAKTATTRIEIENNIKEKEKTLEANQVKIKELQESYSEEWRTEKIALTETAAETEKPKAKLLIEVERLKELDKVAEKIESENALLISKLKNREKVSPLTEKEQEAYKQYEEAYDSATTERKEINSKLSASEKYANKISLRLKNIRGIENNLEITRKNALIDGKVEKVKTAEDAMEYLAQEKASVEKILAESTPEEMLNKQNEIDIVQDKLKNFNQNPLVTQAKRDMQTLKEKIILTPNKTEKTRLRKDLSNHKERYSSVFEIAPKLEKAYKEQKRELSKTEGRLEKLQTQKLTAISNLNLKKSEDLELKIENQEKLINSSRNRLSSMLPGEADRLMTLVQEEKVKGTVPFIPQSSRTPTSFDELYKAIDNSKGVQGSRKFYSPKELKEVIEDVRAGKKTLSHITRGGGIREMVRKLISLEKKNTS